MKVAALPGAAARSRSLPSLPQSASDSATLTCSTGDRGRMMPTCSRTARGWRPEVSGRIVALHVTNNQRVTKGQPLVEIDPEPFELRLRQAQAQVAALKAQISLTGRQVDVADVRCRCGGDADQSRAGAARAGAGHAAPPGAAAGEGLRDQAADRRGSDQRAQCRHRADRRHAAGRIRRVQAVGDTASLVAQLAGAEATEALAARDLRVATLRAPFDGTVVGLQIAEGAYAADGASAVHADQGREWYAVADFRETELSAHRSGRSRDRMVDGR